MIIVSMTTSPKRIHTLKTVLKRLMEQTIQPDKIVLNIPHIFKRTGETYTIPDYLYQPWLYINRCEDIGPATKILPTRLLFKDPNTIIISVDDDILYKKNMIETFLKYSHLPYVLSGGLSGSYKKVKIGDEYLNVSQLIEGHAGVFYRKKHLDKIKLSLDFKNCFTSDDFTISNQLGKHKIEILKIPNTIDKILKIGLKKDALHLSEDNNKRYQECANHLKKQNQLFIEHFYIL
jgi:hypothetical protein